MTRARWLAAPARPSGGFHAFLWQESVMTDLGAFDIGHSFANGINDQGQVVGYTSSNAYYHALLWQDGPMTDLGTLPGFFSASSQAAAINDAGQVVGGSYGMHTG